MNQPTEREVRNKFEQVIEQTGSGVSDDVTVLWGTADPSTRPEGVTWVPESNTLTYDLWGAQRQTLTTLDSDTDITAFLAGYGSGKTIFGARWLIKNALDHDGSRFLGMGIDFTKARDTTFRVLFEQLPGERTGIVTSSYNGPEQSPVVEDYNRQNHRLTFVNDTVVKLGSADKWNRYAGDEYGGVWLDEPSHYGEDLHDLLEMIGSRLRGVDGPKAQLWTLTGNGHNAAFDILERKEDSDGEALGLNIELVRASTLENPYLDTGEKERFERQYGNTSRESQALYGGFSQSTGALLSRDQLSFVHLDDLEDENLRYHLGVDLSYVSSKQHAEATDSDYTAVALVGVDSQNKQAYLIDIARERGMSMRKGIQWLSDLASQVPNPTVKVEKVGAQNFWIQEAQEAVPGNIVPVSPGTESKDSRITDMSIAFERGDVVLVNRDIDENLGYDARLRPFVREWCEFGSSDNSPDLLDAAYYALTKLNLRQSGTQVLGADMYGRKEGSDSGSLIEKR
ncbi:terminase large subunit domain-containing protein [Halorientalis marina]|uniref:terminase large subunit domain-containing protein n=1 Tax=Halorientalis marina TaxID=2931976 RepID=UPI001FF28B94|nr:terminase family protein [Halorientalis marina]